MPPKKKNGSFKFGNQKKVTVDADVQTDELIGTFTEVSIVDRYYHSDPVACTSLEELSKEQLIARLRSICALTRRQEKMFLRQESAYMKQKDRIQEIAHIVKLILIDHRQAYTAIKELLQAAGMSFANGRVDLEQSIRKINQTIDEDKRVVMNDLARNELAVEKTKAAVELAKIEIERVREINEDLKSKNKAINRDRKSIEEQLAELRQKQKNEYLTSEQLCPKCKSYRSFIDELADKVNPLKLENKELLDAKMELEEHCRRLQAEQANLQRFHKRVLVERDAYKSHNEKLMERQKHLAKAASTAASSHNLMVKASSAGSSPQVAEAAVVITVNGKATPKDESPATIVSPKPQCATTSDSPDPNPVQKTKEPPPIKKENSGRPLEDGEVTSPDVNPSPAVATTPVQEVKSEPPATATTTTPEVVSTPSNERKRKTVSPKDRNKKKVTKPLDMVYIIDDKPRSSKSNGPKHPRDDVRHMNPWIQDPSPPYFNPPRYRPPMSQQQRMPRNPYHLTPPPRAEHPYPYPPGSSPRFNQSPGNPYYNRGAPPPPGLEYGHRYGHPGPDPRAPAPWHTNGPRRNPPSGGSDSWTAWR